MSEPVASDEHETLKVAVISDLHAHDGPASGASPSLLNIGAPENLLEQHPIASLVKLIQQEALSADILLCPGDLTNKAQPTPLNYAWRKIHELSALLDAKLVAATAGNHDLDSRHHADFDAKGMLQSLVPPFPLADEALSDKYWSRNFAVVEGVNYRLIVLNSSAYHGQKPEEIDHGRVARSTLARMKTELDAVEPKRVNILLCHHHLIEHRFSDTESADQMLGGGDLLHLLGTDGRGTWLVVHGHKHYPKVMYGPGGADAPVLFSSGSLCGDTGAGPVRNQFHIITVDLTESATRGLAGTIRSWDWLKGHGYRIPQPMSGLPHLCGFGYRTSARQLAHRIATLVTDPMHEWEFVRSLLPDVDFLLPQDFENLRRELKSVGLSVLEEHGLPIQIGRRT